MLAFGYSGRQRSSSLLAGIGSCPEVHLLWLTADRLVQHRRVLVAVSHQSLYEVPIRRDLMNFTMLRPILKSLLYDLIAVRIGGVVRI